MARRRNLGNHPKIKPKEQKVSRFRLYFSVGIVSLWIIIGYFVFQDVGEFFQWFDSLGSWASVIYCLMVTIAVVIFIPTPILKVGAGALFPYWIAGCKFRRIHIRWDNSIPNGALDVQGIHFRNCFSKILD